MEAGVGGGREFANLSSVCFVMFFQRVWRQIDLSGLRHVISLMYYPQKKYLYRKVKIKINRKMLR